MDPRLLSRKTKSTMGGGLNEVAAQQPSMSDFGARMLAKFGWKEGEGLGKKKDGMKEHIRVKQRKDGLGLGADAEPVKSEWAAPELKVVAAKRDGSDSDDSDDEDDAAEAAVRQRIQGSGVIPGMSDADLFKICGGARLGMRARAKQDGKQARMEEADRKLAAQRAAAGKAAACNYHQRLRPTLRPQQSWRPRRKRRARSARDTRPQMVAMQSRDHHQQVQAAPELISRVFAAAGCAGSSQGRCSGNVVDGCR